MACSLPFDALANARSPYDDLRYGMSEPQDGVKVQSYSPRSEAVPLNVAVAVRYVGYKRMCEWALPWGDLVPVSPHLLAEAGFSFSLNDNDGGAFESNLEVD